mgnify:CR=1 FL=1
MDRKIEVKIYGNENELFGTCCSKNKENSKCGGGCSGCSSSQTCIKAFDNLKEFLAASEVKENVELIFIEADSRELLNNEELREWLKSGYTLPFITIDGIFRYYGGISNQLVLKDVKELLE